MKTMLLSGCMQIYSLPILLDEQEEGRLFHEPEQEHRHQAICLRSALPATRANLNSKEEPEDDQNSREEEVEQDDKPGICKGGRLSTSTSRK